MQETEPKPTRPCGRTANSIGLLCVLPEGHDGACSSGRMPTTTTTTTTTRPHPAFGATHPTLCRLARDVVNTTKRDKRMTRDWRHAETWRAGKLFVVKPWRGDFHGTDEHGMREVGPLDGYGHERAIEGNDHERGREVFALLVPHLEPVREDSVGALLVRYDGASAETVLAVLLDRNQDLRAVVVECFKRVEAGYHATEGSALDEWFVDVTRREVLS